MDAVMCYRLCDQLKPRWKPGQSGGGMIRCFI